MPNKQTNKQIHKINEEIDLAFHWKFRLCTSVTRVLLTSHFVSKMMKLQSIKQHLELFSLLIPQPAILVFLKTTVI